MGNKNAGFVNDFTGRQRNALMRATRHGNAGLAQRLAVFVVIAGEAELRHGVVAALPLRGALGSGMGEEEVRPVFVLWICARFFFAQAIGMFGYGVWPIFPQRAIERIELRAQNAAPQSAQGIALHSPDLKCSKKIVYRLRMVEKLRIAVPVLIGPILLMPVAELLADRALMEPRLAEGGRGKMRIYGIECRILTVQSGCIVFRQ